MAQAIWPPFRWTDYMHIGVLLFKDMQLEKVGP